jgi:hypothetical protein
VLPVEVEDGSRVNAVRLSCGRAIDCACVGDAAVLGRVEPVLGLLKDLRVLS